MKKIIFSLFLFFGLFLTSKTFAWNGEWYPYSWIQFNGTGQFCGNFGYGNECRTANRFYQDVPTQIRNRSLDTIGFHYSTIFELGYSLPYSSQSYNRPYMRSNISTFAINSSSTGSSDYVDLWISSVPGIAGNFSVNDWGKDQANGYCNDSGWFWLNSQKKTLALCKVQYSDFQNGDQPNYQQYYGYLQFNGNSDLSLIWGNQNLQVESTNGRVKSDYNGDFFSNWTSITSSSYGVDGVNGTPKTWQLSEIPIMGSSSGSSVIPTFSWSGVQITGSLASVISDLENTWGFDSSWCSSGAWSGIVNSPTQLFTWSEKSTALYQYCGYLDAVASGQNQLIIGYGDQTNQVSNTGALILINQNLADMWGITDAWCSSGAWSGIVNSPTQLYTWSRQASDVWRYCQNKTSIDNGESNLIINYDSYPYGKFFVCSHWLVQTGFVEINLSNMIPSLFGFSMKGSFLDFDIAKPVRCMYSSYLYGANMSKFTFESMPWSGQLFFLSSPYYQNTNETNRAFLIYFCNLLLVFPALIYSIKKLK